MRDRNRLWLLAWTLASLFPHITVYDISSENESVTKNNASRGVFSPRMDYEQWTPLGRGDPLKNDPTYDYVPPVLDRVHYWIDPASRKPDASIPGESQKTEILVLGVSSKKPSSGISLAADSRRDTYDNFLKYVDSPQFDIQNYPRMPKPYYSMQSSYFPTSSYNKNKQNDFSSTKNERVPYTMLMPPPLPTKKPIAITFEEDFSGSSTTESSKSSIIAVTTSDPSSFTIQHSNLLYHSSTLGSEDEFKLKPHFGSVDAPSNQVTWRTPFSTKTENFTVTSNFTNNLVTYNNDFSTMMKEIPEVMHKGLVTDDNLDIQNTYVNIGKPEAQVHPPNDMEVSGVSVKPPRVLMLMHPLPSTNAMLPFTKPNLAPLTLQTLETMQTMKAPPVSQPPLMDFSEKATSSLQGLLFRETDPLTPSNRIPTFMSTTPSFTTTTTTTTTTTASSLTTDSLFKHYKQPVEPLKGPLYLIIQGHSKVKTYGANKSIHGIPVQESNEIPTSEEKMKYGVKHLHGYKKEIGQGRLRQGRSDKLQTLSQVVETGLGAIDFSESTENRRADDDVQEAEFVIRYDVSDVNSTSERYHKGIVEEGDMARNIKDDGTKSRT